MNENFSTDQEYLLVSPEPLVTPEAAEPITQTVILSPDQYEGLMQMNQKLADIEAGGKIVVYVALALMLLMVFYLRRRGRR